MDLNTSKYDPGSSFRLTPTLFVLDGVVQKSSHPNSYHDH